MIEPTRLHLLASLALCGLAAATGTAAAQAPGARTVTPPAGWTPQPVKSTAARPGAAMSSVETYYPPAATAPSAEPRPAALYVTRIERKVAPERRDAIASAEIEEIFAAQRRQGANAKTEASARRADPAGKQLEAALTWRDTSLGMVDTSRVIVAADAQRVVAVTGQCLLAAGAPAELAKACEAALATLDPGIPAAARVPLSMAAEPAPVEPPPASAGAPRVPAAADGPASPRAGPAPARLDDASHVELPSRQSPPERSADRRPIYIGLGLVGLALLFWWNRRRRDQLEAADRRADAERGGGGGDDDEDLHAAADEPTAAKPDPDRKEKDA
jgi:hypothetical protein